MTSRIFTRSSFVALLRDTTAGVSAIATFSLPVIIGAGGLALDLNRGYQQREINQRAADMAALGAALAYTKASNGDILQPVAQDLVLANGIGDAEVGAEIVQDFPNNGDQSVRVEVSRDLPFSLAAVVGITGSFSVTAQSIASLTSSVTYAPPCFLALEGGASSISVTGGASINAPDCSVAAIGTVENKGTLIRGADIISGSADITVNHGELDANTLRYAGIFSVPQWNTAVPPEEDRINEPTTLIDPWATDPELLSAYLLLGTFEAPSAIASPSVACGSDFRIRSSGASASVAAFKLTSSVFEFPAATYVIGDLNIGGGMDVSFADGATIKVCGDVTIGGGSTVDFGNSTVIVAGDFESGSNGVTIGNGALWIGGDAKFEGDNEMGDGDVFVVGDVDFWGGSSNVWGEGRHLIGGTVDVGGGADVLMGAGDFQAGESVNMSGDSELALGDGDIAIGTGNSNNAIKMMGSARFFMGDGRFSADGNIDTAGGTRLVFGKAANHYINGDLSPKGSVLFGRGRYTVNGDFENGTGGTVWPYTSDLTGLTYGDVVEGISGVGFDMVGIDVTFILSGVIKLAGGAKTKLYAATYDVGGSIIAELLASSQSEDDTNWTGGSVNAFAGTIHFPNAQVKLAGGNTTDPMGRCMTLIASTIRVNGGAATGTACDRMDSDSGSGSGSTATIRLVG